MSADLDLIATAMRRLEAAARASTAEEVDQRLDRFIVRGARSPERLDAAFAATQTLRDLELINADEAAYVLSELCSAYVERTSKSNPLGKVPETEAEVTRLLDLSRRRDEAVMAALLRERGEVALADMLLNNADAYGTLCAEGEISLMMDIPDGESGPVSVKDPKQMAAVSERILGSLSSEMGAGWYDAWRAMTSAINDGGSASAVPAVQNLRDLGAISFEESLALIDMMVDSEVVEALEADREARRLAHAIESLEARLKESPPADGDTDPRVAEREHLSRMSMRRYDRWQAVCLRRHGEHRMANLLIADPAQYDRIRDEGI